MVWVCPRWYDGAPLQDGDTIAGTYFDRACNLYVEGYADIDEDGNTDNFEANDPPKCGEHDVTAEWHTIRFQGALIALQQSNLYTCEEHGDDHGATIIFNTEEALQEHNLEAHGATPATTTAQPAPTPGTYWHDAPLFPHPAIPPERLEKATRLAKTDTIRGLLIAGHTIPQERAINKGVLTTSRPPTPDALLRWAMDYPGWFYIDKNDPHLTPSPGKTTHAGWA